MTANMGHGDEREKLLAFIAEKARTATRPFVVRALSKEYVGPNATDKTLSNACLKIIRLRRKLEEVNGLGKYHKVRLLFAMSVPINPIHLVELKIDAHVEVDHLHRITKYYPYDNTFLLEGVHRKERSKNSRRLTQKKNSDALNQSDDLNDDDDDDDIIIEEELDETGMPYQYTGFLNQGAAPLNVQRQEAAPGPFKRETDKIVSPIQQLQRIQNDFNFYQNFGKVEEAHYGQIPEDVIQHSVEKKMGVANESISVIEFLKLLRSMVKTLESPLLNRIQEKLDKKITDMSEQESTVQINIIMEALESTLRIVSKHASPTIPMHESTCLKDFLLILRMTSFHLGSTGLDNFRSDLKSALNDAETVDKRVSFEKIQYGLGYAIEYVLP